MDQSLNSIPLPPATVIEDIFQKNCHVEVVRFPAESVLRAADFKHKKLYLLSGKLEVNRRGQVPHIHTTTNKWKRDNPIFSHKEEGEYGRCLGKCKLLIVSRTEKHFSEDLKSGSSENPEVDNFLASLEQHADVKNVSSIETRRLQRELEKMTALNEDLSVLLDNKSSQLHELMVAHVRLTAKCKQNYAKYKDLKKEVRRLENEVITKKPKIVECSLSEEKRRPGSGIHALVTEKVSGLMKQLISFMRKNIPQTSCFSLETRSPVATDEWHSIEHAMPIKNGLYYVSDGTKTSVSFFNRDKMKFFVDNGLDIRYWSLEQVRLPQ